MKTCAKCLLPENFPGIHFDGNQVCNFCRDFRGMESLEKQRIQYRQRFEDLVRVHRRAHGYDVLMCYSGGKDSTYTLDLLKREYNLKILAVTYDNGFVPEQTFRNIRQVAERLEIDSMIFKPDFQLLRKVFRTCAHENIYPPKTLERATAICTSCMAFVKFSSLRMALDQRIPFIAFGWSPGQAPIAASLMKNNPEMIRLTQNVVFDPLYRVAGEGILPYFLEERHFQEADHFPYNISPLAFFAYDENAILASIRDLGWHPPRETDANSTNCLLNSFSNQNHLRKYGFHPYAFEVAGLIRKGVMSLEEGRKKLSEPENPEVVAYVAQRLGFESAGAEKN